MRVARDMAELVSSVLIAAFGAYVTYAAARLEYASEFGPGPGFFPFWLGIGIFSLGAALAVRAALGAPRAAEGVRGRSAGLGRAAVASLAFLLAIALVPGLGFTMSFALLSAFLIFFMERRSLLFSLAASAGLALGFHLLFVRALGLGLPPGPWGF
jgi:putative tricarboxylic transport membrane protein